MVYFIGSGIDVTAKLETLRSLLIRNSRDLLSLFKERVEIAKEIGVVKKSHEIKIRDRTRELQVIDDLGISDPIEERFLNLLFELTILAELHLGDSPDYNPGSNEDKLQEMLAETICSPGDMIFMSSNADVPFVRKAVRMGAHLIEEETCSFDEDVGIRFHGNNTTISISNGSLADYFRGNGNNRTPKKIMIEVVD